MNSSLRRRRRQENRIKLIAALVAVAIILTFLFNVVLANSNVQGDVDISGKGYITITVEAKDTLWSIAEAYMNDDYYTYDSFINEVARMNRIEEDEIYAGDQLLIPVIAINQ